MRKITYASILAIALSGTAQGQQTAQLPTPLTASTATYNFSTVRPPLLSETNGAIFEVPAASLQSETWTAEWDTDAKDRHIKIKRKLYWAISQVPYHYNTDTTFKVTRTTGYSTTNKEAFEKNIGGSLGGTFFGIKAEIKSDLKITSSVESTWQEENKTEIDRTYKEGNTYCTWVLYDVMTLNSVPALADVPPDVEMVSVISVYEDSIRDEKSTIYKSAEKSYLSTISDGAVLAAESQTENVGSRIENIPNPNVLPVWKDALQFR